MPYRRNTHGQLRLQGKRVLVAEDEPLVAMDLEAILEDAGAVVYGPAATLVETMRLIETGDFDVAVLDVDLRGENVIPAADKLASRGVALVFHTGHAHPAMLKERFPHAVVCVKPVWPETIIKSVETAAAP